MSDEELRRLERLWRTQPTKQNLRELNLHRGRLGLHLYREDLFFLAEWFQELGVYNISPEKLVTPATTWPRHSNYFLGRVPIEHPPLGCGQDVLICVTYYESEEEKVKPPIFPKLDCLDVSFYYPLKQADEHFKSGKFVNIGFCEQRCILTYKVWADHFEIHQVVFRENEPNTPHTEFLTQTNNPFVDAAHLLEVALPHYMRIAEKEWSLLKTKTFDALVRARFMTLDVKRDYFKFYICAAEELQIDLYSRRNSILDEAITQVWFEEDLRIFSQSIERIFQSEDLLFDQEGSWARVHYRPGGYQLEIDTGYNEIVDPDDVDLDDPQGQRYGNVSDVISQIERIFERLADNYPEFDIEWSLAEEYEEGSEDLAIHIKLTTPLNWYVLWFILEKQFLN